jgi:hypothetical protein
VRMGRPVIICGEQNGPVLAVRICRPRGRADHVSPSLRWAYFDQLICIHCCQAGFSEYIGQSDVSYLGICKLVIHEVYR